VSTRSSIKYEMADDGTGFHLYDDWLDGAISAEPPVYLELSGVAFESSSDCGGSVTVAIPREWAKKLGLVRAPTPAAQESGDA